MTCIGKNLCKLTIHEDMYCNSKMMSMKLRRFIEYSMAGSAVPVSVTTTDSPGCGRHTAAGASSRCHRASSIHCTSRSTENDRIYIESSWSTVINSRLSRSRCVYNGKKKHECYPCRLGASKQPCTKFGI